MKNNDEFKIDTTGEYFAIGGAKFKKKAVDKTQEEDEMFFASNVFLFWLNADKILNNNKMRNAKVPCLNGLMYTGTSGFNNPTLGVYVEWWKANDDAFVKNENGKVEAIMYRFGGSPLSGMNFCKFVHVDGSITEVSVYSKFKGLWSSFMHINQETDKDGEAFDIQDVVKKLKRQNRIDKLIPNMKILGILTNRIKKLLGF